MIRFEAVTVTYADADQPALRDVDLAIPEGELVVVIGRTGAGKSTLLKAINGLVPHFTGGTLAGRVTVDGRDTRLFPPRELADVVGYVGQDPLAGFVTDSVEEELAYAMESLGIAPDVMRRRVEDILDSLGLVQLRHRSLPSLSSGEQQRVAIGSVLTAGARVLVLDEPTSALDPPAAEDVLASLTRLVHDLGVTVVAAEHRLERVVQYADRIVQVGADGRVHDSTPAKAMEQSTVAPPVVELGRLVKWQPLPLSVRDARRAADGLRARLASMTPPADAPAPTREPVVSVQNLHDHYDEVIALRGVDLAVRPGEIVALMGRNGAGKSSLIKVLCGADSAGISLETEEKSDAHYYRWVATAGQYNGFFNAVLPRYPSACGICLERGKPQLFRVRQRFFDIMGIKAPLVTDGILLPWQVEETRGTIFIMAHGRSAAFDKNDGQMMRVLADFAAMAVRHRQQQDALLQQAKAAAAAAMAGKLAHHINNPLQSLINIAYLAAEGQSNHSAKTLGQELSADLRRLSDVVTESLAFPADRPRQN